MDGHLLQEACCCRVLRAVCCKWVFLYSLDRSCVRPSTCHCIKSVAINFRQVRWISHKLVGRRVPKPIRTTSAGRSTVDRWGWVLHVEVWIVRTMHKGSTHCSVDDVRADQTCVERSQFLVPEQLLPLVIVTCNSRHRKIRGIRKEVELLTWSSDWQRVIITIIVMVFNVPGLKWAFQVKGVKSRQGGYHNSIPAACLWTGHLLGAVQLLQEESWSGNFLWHKMHAHFLCNGLFAKLFE